MIARHLRSLVGLTGVVILVVFGVRLVQGLSADYSGDSRLPRRDIPTAPVDVPVFGTYVDSTLTDDGEVEVRQWIRSATPVDSLSLTMSDPGGQPGDTLRARAVDVTGPDGTRLALGDEIDSTTATLPLREAATELFLTYTISGGSIADETSTVPGRSLLRVTAMDVDWDGESGLSVRLVRGPGTVLNAACLEPDPAEGISPRACGVPAVDGDWEVTLHPEHVHDYVVAQLQADADPPSG